jgi:hypothetical protein
MSLVEQGTAGATMRQAGAQKRHARKRKRHKRTPEQLREDVQRKAAAMPQNVVRVIPFLQWCVLRGVSVPTGRRLIARGELRATRLSKRRLGIRTDHDLEYLNAREVTS